MKEFVRVTSGQVDCAGQPMFRARVTRAHLEDPNRIRRARERAAADVNWAMDEVHEVAEGAYAAGLTVIEAWNKNAYKPGEYPGTPTGACVRFNIHADGTVSLGGGHDTPDWYSRASETPIWGPLIWARYQRWLETCYRYSFLKNLLKESVR